MELGEVYVKIGADIVPLETALGKARTVTKNTTEQMRAQMKTLGKGMIIAGAAITAAFALTVKSAISFQKELAQVSTMLDESAMKIMPQYKSELLKMSVAFGEATGTLSRGLYDILSASIPPTQALDVLAVAATAAVAGITDTGVSADAVTTILNSYGMSADRAGEVSDILFATVKRGKCLTGDTRVLLSDGRYKRIDSLNDEKGLEVITWDYRNFVSMKAKFVDMGTKQTVKIITAMGREIRTTPEHPYLTPEGWVKIKDLRKDDKIAVPSSLPFFGNKKVKDGWPELLGYLLAEGSIQSGSPELAIGDDKILEKVKDAAKRYGIKINEVNIKDKTTCGVYNLVAGSRGGYHKNPIIEKLREYKLWGTNCYTKFIPDEVFSWSKDDIAKLVHAYFSGDGWLTANDKGRQLGVCSVSKKLIDDVSHLLLRFGINGYIRKNSENSWIWESVRYVEIKRFIDYIGIERNSVNTFLNYIPQIRGNTEYLTSYGKERRKKEKYRPYKGLVFTDNQLYYDRIKEIKYEKVEKVYDLIVPKLHNFVANDIVAHNTTFAELAPSIGKVAATAAISGLSLEDLGASIATITRAGIRSEEAMTAINGVLRAFLKPTDEAKDAAKEFGLTMDTNTLKTEGLTGVMDKLKDATAEQLAAIFPNIRGLKGMAAALGDAEGYAEDYALMLNSAGLTQEAFAKQSATLGFKIDQLKKSFSVVATTVGDVLIPVVQKIVEHIMTLVLKMKEWMDKHPGLTKAIVLLGAALGVLTGAGGVLILGALYLTKLKTTMIGVAATSNKVLVPALGRLRIALNTLGGAILVAQANLIIWFEVWKEYQKIMDATVVTAESVEEAELRLAKAQEATAKKFGVTLEVFQEWQKSGKAVHEISEDVAAVMDKLAAKRLFVEQTKELAEFEEKIRSMEIELSAMTIGSKQWQLLSQEIVATKEEMKDLKDAMDKLALAEGIEQDAQTIKTTVADIILDIDLLVKGFELTGKSVEESATYYGTLIEKLNAVDVILQTELMLLVEGTEAYKKKQAEILENAKAISEVEENLKKLIEPLQGLDLITAQIALLGDSFEDKVKKLNQALQDLKSGAKKASKAVEEVPDKLAEAGEAAKEAGEAGKKAGDETAESWGRVVVATYKAGKALTDFTVKGVAAAIATIKMQYYPINKKLIEDINAAYGYYAGIWRRALEAELVAVRKNMQEQIDTILYGWKEYQKILAKMEESRGAGTPSYQFGTPYVPRTGLALVHRGERITPANQNTYNNAFSPTFNMTIQGGGSPNRIAQEVERVLYDTGRQFKRRGFEIIPGRG